MYLEKINSPSDIKKLSVDEMKKLTQEMRDALIFKLSRHGGHCGPNLGFAEATVALHLSLIHIFFYSLKSCGSNETATAFSAYCNV